MMVSAEGKQFPPGAQMEGFLRSTEKEEQGERKCRRGQLAGGGWGLGEQVWKSHRQEG